MIRRDRRTGRGRVGVRSAALALAAMALAGCGNNGNSDVLFPTPGPITEAAISGVVSAPNGQFASVEWWQRWPQQLRLVPPAYALQNVAPITQVIPVSVSRVDDVDAADGHIDSPFEITPPVRTDSSGAYQVIDNAVANVDQCRLMVAVGGGSQLTRAFVMSHTTDINATSEALVRVVLDRLTKAPPVQLCDFKTPGLLNILAATQQATFLAAGTSVAEINQDAYDRAKTNRLVKQAIDDATGVPVATP